MNLSKISKSFMFLVLIILGVSCNGSSGNKSDDTIVLQGSGSEN